MQQVVKYLLFLFMFIILIFLLKSKFFKDLFPNETTIWSIDIFPTILATIILFLIFNFTYLFVHPL